VTDLTFTLAADSNFAMQLAVALRSLAAHHPDGCRVFVMHDAIDDALRARIVRGLPSAVEVAWFSVRSPGIQAAHRPDFLPPASLFRLTMPSLLPASVDRLVYLDADTVVRSSLAPLFATDLGSNSCGAVHDPLVPWAGAPMGLPGRELGVAPSTPYFNAGVLVVSLDRWRADDVEVRSLMLLAQHRLRWADQCALNAVITDQWTAVPPVWNLQSGHLIDKSLAWVVESVDEMDAALADPAVVHYTNTRYRPWQWRCDHPFRGEWTRTLQQTDWAGWTPPTDYQRIVIAAQARVRKLWRRFTGS
jgi:lipopolysaccharide biosynthesis glycosyltransferase